MTARSGTIEVNGRISYASQEAWIYSGTVRQNVLFGEAFDEKRYFAVTSACALNHDIEHWEQGDMTLVGERGVVLSGRLIAIRSL